MCRNKVEDQTKATPKYALDDSSWRRRWFWAVHIVQDEGRRKECFERPCSYMTIHATCSAFVHLKNPQNVNDERRWHNQKTKGNLKNREEASYDLEAVDFFVRPSCQKNYFWVGSNVSNILNCKKGAKFGTGFSCTLAVSFDICISSLNPNPN